MITGILAGAMNGAGTDQFATVTIASGTVASTLTNFPVMVRLSGMPAGFWSAVRQDGRDIRVTTTGGTPVACDLARFDYTAQDGVLFFRAASIPSGSSAAWQIHYGNPARRRLAFTDAIGRNAVWADYAAVFLLGETNHSRTGGAAATHTSDPDCFEVVATSPDTGSHQGVCWDGTYYYTSDTGTLYKWDASWTLVASNTNVWTATGIPGAAHLGAIDVFEGVIYGGVVGSTTAWITKWDASTLGFLGKFDVTTQSPASAAAVCVRPDTRTIFLGSYTDGNQFWEYTLDGAYLGTFPVSATLIEIQGLAFWRNAFWAALDNGDETFRVELDGTVQQSGLFGAHAATVWEGVAPKGDTLLQLEDNGTTRVVSTYKPYDITLGAGGGVNFWADARITAALASVGAVGTAWTMGVTAIPDGTANRNILSLTAAGTGTTQTAVIDVSTTAKYALWDSTNSFLNHTIAPVAGVARRLNATYNGTTSRSLFINGANKVTQSGITARGSGAGVLVIGNGVEGGVNAPWRGKLGFAYVRAGVLSDAWIAAEYANLNSPGTFYTIS